MNNILQLYFSEGNNTNVDASEIRYIIDQNADYSFIPRVKGYSFWYNKKQMQIQYSKFSEIIELNGRDKYTDLSSTINNERTLEELKLGYLLLDKDGSELARVIYQIRNLTSTQLFTSLVNVNMQNFGITDLYEHLSSFNPNTTLYINDFLGITNSAGTINKIVYCDGIKSIPTGASSTVGYYKDEFGNDLMIKIPISVAIIEENAFTTIIGNNKINLSNTRNVEIYSNSFSSELNQANSLNFSPSRQIDRSGKGIEVVYDKKVCVNNQSVENSLDGELKLDDLDDYEYCYLLPNVKFVPNVLVDGKKIDDWKISIINDSTGFTIYKVKGYFNNILMCSSVRIIRNLKINSLNSNLGLNRLETNIIIVDPDNIPQNYDDFYLLVVQNYSIYNDTNIRYNISLNVNDVNGDEVLELEFEGSPNDKFTYTDIILDNIDVDNTVKNFNGSISWVVNDQIVYIGKIASNE
jgi:hypothetical protein